MKKEFLTTHEAATELSVRRTTVLGMINTGQLTAVDVSVNAGAKRPSYRIPREALDELLAKRTKRPETAKPARVRRATTARFYS